MQFSTRADGSTFYALPGNPGVQGGKTWQTTIGELNAMRNSVLANA